jgi:mono/diheme cytochrome c family protein
MSPASAHDVTAGMKRRILIATCIAGAITAGASAGAQPGTAVIERGRYLVKTTGCNDCHTPGYLQAAGRVPESRWLTGDKLGWQGPWGTTYPPNLRLFVQGVSADQFLQLARREMRPPMPWFAVRDMTDADVRAIYWFTRSLGPAGKPAPAFLPPGQTASTPVVKVPAG